MHLVFFPFLSVNHIIAFTRDAEIYGLVAFKSRVVVAEHAKGNLLSTQFLPRIIDSETQQLLAIAFTSFRVVNYHKAEADDSLIL